MMIMNMDNHCEQPQMFLRGGDQGMDTYVEMMMMMMINRINWSLNVAFNVI